MGRLRISLGYLQNRAPGINSLSTELLLDADELIVFRRPVGARERPGFYLPAVCGDGQVGDRGVLGLAGTVRHDGSVGRLVRHLHGSEASR